LAVQPDGKVLVGGELTSLGGQPRSHIGRLLPDGSLDSGFNPGADGVVYSLAVQPDGKILVGGSFSTLGGQTRNHIGRLNSDGSLDAGFNQGTDGEALALALQADGKIIVAGNFNTLGGQARTNIGRLNTNGTVDSAFHPGADSVVVTVAVQPDGKILAGGGFFNLAGQGRSFIGRLNSDGTLDTNFTAGAGNWVYSMSLQSDGKIMVGGLFTSINGQPRNNLARLNADGTLDTNFTTGVSPPGYISDIKSLALQADGRILVGGSYAALAGQPWPGLGRLNSDGTADTNFIPGVGGVYSLAIQKDGRFLAGGWGFLARFNNTTVATETLTRSGATNNTTLTWLRGGGGPEVWRTTFETSTNGTAWTNRGAGTRIAGGWQLTGVSAPTSAYIRVRGFAEGGYFNASSSFVESFIGPVMVVTQPASLTNNAGATANFSVLAGGTPALNYRWRKSGASLADSGNVFGSGTASLTLSNVLHADAAAYTVVISNNFGAVTSIVANLTVIDPVINSQPTNVFIDVGQTAQFSVAAAGTALTYQWNKNGVPRSGATNSSLTLTNVQGPDSGSSYFVVVSNAFGSVTGTVATLTVNLATVDALNPAPNYPVRSLAVQAEGKIVMSGYFSAVSGQTQVGIARLNPDGSLDTNFTAGILGIPFSTALPVVALQEDGKFLIAGGVSSLNGYGRNQIGRFNPDGSVDAAFNPGADADIDSMTLQADGKIVVGGSFTNLNGQARSGLGRLNPDGSLDTNFNSGASGTVYSIAVQPDGKLVVGGNFTKLAGQARTNIGRLNSDGGLDTNFNPGANGTVNALAVQPDGSILAGGTFTNLGGQTRNYIGRINANGNLDTNFNPGADGMVSSFALQSDGRIVVGGSFTILGAQPRSNVGRLNSDGSVDMTFNPGADGAVDVLALQPDGMLLVGGSFSYLDGQARAGIGRLNSTGTAVQSLSYNASTITWLRSGAGPEVWRTAFDVSTNGTGLFRLAGTRAAGGWRVTGLNLPTNTTVRARGFVAGSSDGSSWFVENVIGPVVIEDQPADQTNNPFTQATFTMTATGQTPLSYEWLKNGLRLTNGGNVSGAITSTLTLTNVLGGDAGPYQVVVSNAFGSVTSSVATLTVLDPTVTSQPVSQTNNAGQTVVFTATALGTTTLNYQWLKNGLKLADGGNVSGALTSTLTLTNVLGGDAGAYRLVVSNTWGSVTSIVASLSVNDPVLASQPASQSPNPGQAVLFNVTAVGTSPLNYQWLKNEAGLGDGGNVSGAHAATLMLSNAFGADVGAYRVIVSNVWGSVTSDVAHLNIVDPLLVTNPVSQKVQRGQTVVLSTTVLGTPPLIYQWRKNGTNVPGAAASTLTFTNVQWADAGGYDVLATNALGSVTSTVATLTVNLAPADSLSPSLNNQVLALALQADGKILAGGDFTSLNGQTRLRIARLNPDGSVDTNFNPGASNSVRCLAVQTNGAILAGGDFISLGGQTRSRIGRLNPDGSLDGGFNPGANNSVRAVAVQADGKILVGGLFTTLGGTNCNYLGRLNADGSLDASFNPVISGAVLAIALQPDGRIVVGGGFNAAGGQAHTNLVRLETNGAVNAAFNANSDNSVWCLALQADGKILAGGFFHTMSGQTRNEIARLNADGSLDTAFNPGITHSLYPGVYSLAVQTDGMILVGGIFDTLAGTNRSGIGRLYADGAPDLTFNPADGWVWIYALAVQPDGNVLLGGYFTAIAGQPRTHLARLNNTDAASNSLPFDASTITWLRGGTGPEIWRASFAFSTNGAAWTDVGDGSRTTGGWQLTGLSLPAGAIVRGRGFVVAGSWFVESLGGAPLFTSQPASRTNNATTTATFSVSALGGMPISYQWLKGGIALSDGGNIFGAATPTLTLSNVLGADRGGYSVLLSNSFGSVTSLVASLSVVDPFLTSQPASQSTNVGQTLAFSVTALGTTPLNYQWRRNGTNLTWATNASLTLTNLQRTDAGNYDAIVSNASGSVTSAVAALTVNLALPDAFNPAANGQVTVLVPQADGRILAGGSFTTLGGQTRRGIGRLTADGALDSSFNPAAYSSVNCLVVLDDGRIVLSALAGQRDNFLWRLNADGSADTNFTITPNGPVNALAAQPDGKILAAGGFTGLNKQTTTSVGRFSADGTLDTNFVAVANSTVNCLAVQPDGKILAGGSFTELGGTNRNRIARLNADGTPDLAFNPNANNTVSALALQADGKILLGGSFTTLGGTNRARIGRLNSDGSLDLSFNPGVNGSVYSLAVQTDGKIVVGGSFTTLGGQARSRIGRLNADGTVDLTFNPVANNTVYSVAVQADGAILVGGSFSTVNGQSRTNLARLVNPDSATQSLSFDGSTITWLRGGSSPEVWRASFDLSTNGADWTNLGAGTRISGGWQLTNVSAIASGNIRARGWATGGMDDGSSWIADTIIGPPVITAQPASRTNNAGTTARFFTTGGGTPPLTYQWLKGGIPIADAGNISGTGTPTLTLSNVLGGDAGSYALIVSNASGSITSSVATLFVIEPIITLQPTNQFADAGQSANFTVAAIGSAPFTYQWRKNGTNISAPNSPTLTLADVSRADLGTYSVLVSTPYGSAVSSNAILTINFAIPDSLSVNASDQVRAMAVQPDGKILIGGSFTNLGDQPRNFIGRLNPNGSLDPDFNPGADNIVNCFAVQPDGRILVGGYFQNLSGQVRTCIARLYADGSLDTNFAPSVSLGGTPFVNALAVQPDGKILVGGQLGLLNGQFIPNLGRLNPDGSVDNSFSCPINSPGVLSLALQSDGRILVGGWFCNHWCYLDRLNTNGTVDSTFNTAPSSVIDAIIIQPDGKILVGGDFVRLLSTTRNHLARLNPNCTLDSAFNPGANGPVTSMALQADGKILVGGGFSTLGGQPRSNFGRLNPDGTVDPTCNPGVVGGVGAIAVQADGATLVGGTFSAVAGQPRTNLARLTATGPATQTLICDGTAITWLRGGTSPEIWRASFEVSTDSVNWLSLGDGARVAGGWQLSGLALSNNVAVRARGFVTGGYLTGSGWFVESTAVVAIPPAIVVNDGGFGARQSGFGFNVRAIPGQVVVIDASTDFVQWIPIQTNLVTGSGLFVFTDPQSSLFSRRFYRARLYQGFLPPPAISGGAMGFQAGRFGFNLSGVAGQTAIIEASTNLLNWTALATNAIGAGPLYFSDPASPNFPWRFYRARLQ
jgi:uncharacterized delta-60 repeat protein